MNDRTVYSIASRYGNAAQPDDREASDIIGWRDGVPLFGAMRWMPGSYNVINVSYFSACELAERVASTLAPHRKGASVSVTPHSISADYVGVVDGVSCETWRTLGLTR